MLEKILELRSQSKSIAQIAKECGLTVGQVKYQLQKDKAKLAEDRDRSSTPNQAQRGQEREWRLPAFYGRDLVKVMAQGPSVLFVYWEITWPRMRMVASYMQADYRHIQKCLRIYDVTDRIFDGHNAHSVQDVLVQEDAPSWYVRDVRPGRTYLVDFGLYEQGRYCPILRSEPVETPRNTNASWGEPLVEPAKDSTSPTWFENFSSYSLYMKSKK
ncbi:hypothetical protein AN963_22355 [Brevibacillus choshinensis]|uniref:DUF4912 domain-containing protein n=1 Tax=Brevibacillus choshinensis TaxID=54911 RepID=A0ABR5N136_BRECH|nr:DUF4912 domain-containing protein [Brevibacillus choshinensis]KQL44171.1 hypothetical protein AN963_22355 [Brevibacillus choshinensis]